MVGQDAEDRAATGDFYLFGNDIARGLDIYKFEAGAAKSAHPGTWLSPAEATALLATRKGAAVSAENALFCVLGS